MVHPRSEVLSFDAADPRGYEHHNMSRMPRLIAFDLDYTLWDLWIDTHVTGPLHRHEDTINQILDRNNNPICFYPDVSEILHSVRADGVTVAACSRTDTPKLARQALRLLLISSGDSKLSKPAPAIEFFDELEIYPGSKITHFQQLRDKTGIKYGEMLFFDDEKRNREVETLGVTFVHVPRGLTNKVFEQGLQTWCKNHPE